MTLPRGPVFQLLRAKSLSTVPIGSRCLLQSPVSLREWRTQGYYTVCSTVSRGWDLEAFADDLGGAMLTDAELLLDAIAEQQATIHRSRALEWASPAWLTICGYYWAYYGAMALGRLIGDTIWFLDQAAVTGLTMMSLGRAVSAPRLGPGAYRIESKPGVDPTKRRLEVRREKGGRLHDAVWYRIFATLTQTSDMVQHGSRQGDEHSVYSAIQRACRQFGSSWPSDIRNLVNYRPGYAYGSVRRKNSIDTDVFVRSLKVTGIPEMVALFNREMDRVDGFELASAPRQAGRLVVMLASIIQEIAWAVHDDLVVRHALDKRWLLKRSAFLRERGVESGEIRWPVSIMT